jgi:hypothetical protein
MGGSRRARLGGITKPLRAVKKIVCTLIPLRVTGGCPPVALHPLIGPARAVASDRSGHLYKAGKVWYSLLHAGL